MISFTPSEDFRRGYDAAFLRPILRSAAGRAVWLDLETVCDAVAGPMSNVMTTGHCNYVYRDTEGRFPGVDGPKTFRIWALKLAEEYRLRVLDFRPATTDEEADREALFTVAAALVTIVGLAETEVKR